MQIHDFTKYNLKTYTIPFWKTDVVYNETVMFISKTDSTPLLYKPKQIISVRSYDLEIEYIEGKDYIIKNGKISLTKNTTIPYFKKSEFYLKKEIPGYSFVCTKENVPYIFFGEGDTFTKKQIAITYIAEKNPLKTTIIDFSKNFSKSITKFKEKQKINVLFYGDSITVGANSSNFIRVKPFAETYPEMITSYIKQRFDCDINYINTAVGGVSTEWGINNVNERAIAYKPDLVFIAFGMNNANLTEREYADKIHQIVSPLQKDNPDIEIMLIAPMLPNKLVKAVYGNQYLYEKGLKALSDKYGLAYAPITSVHEEILRTKRYCDMTGNNVNHPNDFLARVYVHVILTALFGEKYINLYEREDN